MTRAIRVRTPLVLLTTLAALTLAACSSETRPEPPKDYARALPPGALALEGPIPVSEWPDFFAAFTDAPDSRYRRRLVESIDRSLSYMQAPSSRKYFPYMGITHERALASLEAFRELAKSTPTREGFRGALEKRFEVYRSVGWNGRGEVLFTAYCEPIYEGSRTPDARYRYPLYSLPPDLVKDPEGKPLGRRAPDGGVVPCPTRGEIDQGGRWRDVRVANVVPAVRRGGGAPPVIDKGEWAKGLELVWLADRFDAYVVHVQGSARIRLPDGSEMRIGYAGKTDRPYASLGEALIADGKIDRNSLSLRGIREHFRANPEEMDVYLAKNESYVFFTEREGGPFGSLGVPVTAWCSLATDKSVYPRAAIAFADTTMPMASNPSVSRRHRAFVLDQDTGGAIRSAGRSDLFLGSGSAAENLAGYVKQEGRLYYVFLRDDSMPPAASTSVSARESPPAGE